MPESKRRLYTKKRENARDTARSAAKNDHKNAAQYTAKFIVQRSDTLLAFLLKKCNQSRNNVKTLLSSGKVLVNGLAEKQFDFPLAKDDEVKIAKSAVKSIDLTQREAQKHVNKREQRSARVPLPKIVYEDDALIAIDKPCGLLSVESDKERLSAYYIVEEYLRQKGKNERAYVLHRIDKDTSGVLLFAKDIKLHSMMRMRWNELAQTREYYAIVSGVFEEKSGEIISYLKEDKNHFVYCVSPAEGKKAVTRYETLKSDGKFSLLRVEIDSGRKNQIRVAMKAAAHPVVGDEKYGLVDSPIKRLGLHASALAIKHPVTGEVMRFSAAVPSEFYQIFKV